MWHRICCVRCRVETKESEIDYAAGIHYCGKSTGNYVQKGEILAVLYAEDLNKFETAAGMVKDAFIITDSIPEERPLIYARVGKEGTEKYPITTDNKYERNIIFIK